jgi:hypothetical protein
MKPPPPLCAHAIAAVSHPNLCTLSFDACRAWAFSVRKALTPSSNAAVIMVAASALNACMIRERCGHDSVVCWLVGWGFANDDPKAAYTHIHTHARAFTPSPTFDHTHRKRAHPPTHLHRLWRVHIGGDHSLAPLLVAPLGSRIATPGGATLQLLSIETQGLGALWVYVCVIVWEYV